MLLTNENYFSKEADKEYMSVSQYKAFKECEEKTLAIINEMEDAVEKEAFLEGQLFENLVAGDAKLFLEDHPEIVSSRGPTKGEIKSNFKKVFTAAERIKEQKFLMDKINKCQKQVVLTCVINGVNVKCCLDLLDLENKAIYDLKCMANFQEQWNKKDKCYVPWYYAWGYVLQLAVYQEAVRQNFGVECDVHLIAATKEEIPDMDAPKFDNQLLKMELEEFSNDIQYFDEIKKGLKPATRCEGCDHCKKTKEILNFREVS